MYRILSLFTWLVMACTPVALAAEELSTQEKIKASRQYYNEGWEKLRAGNYAAAIRDYDKSIELYPYRVDAYYFRAIAKYESEKYEGALEDYNHAVEMSPNYQRVYINRSRTRRKLGDYKGSLDDAEKAIALNSESARAYVVRALAKYRISRNHYGAMQDIRKAERLAEKKGNEELLGEIRYILAWLDY